MNLKYLNLFSKAPCALKKVTAVMLCLVLVGLCLSVVGCVKQKNCEEGISGTFLYLKEPYKTNGKFIKRDVKITAHFIGEDKFSTAHYITGTIPQKFQTDDSIRVRISLSEIRYKPSNKDVARMPISSLKCIEKED